MLSTTAAGVGVFGYAHDVEPAHLEITHTDLTLPHLTPAFDGYRVVQISDIHLDGAVMTRDHLAHIVDQVNRQHPDLVAITGDFVSYDPDFFAPDLIEPLRKLAPRDAALAVLGNHDHWTDAPTVRAIVDDCGLTNISNGTYTLSREGELLHFGRIDDYWEQQDRLDLVLDALPDEGAAILLAHEPDFADISAATGRFDLQLSGHSHGGQIILPVIGPPVLPTFGQKYPVGRYRIGDMIQYTNRGVGVIPPRVRLNCRPEISVFTLRTRKIDLTP